MTEWKGFAHEVRPQISGVLCECCNHRHSVSFLALCSFSAVWVVTLVAVVVVVVIVLVVVVVVIRVTAVAVTFEVLVNEKIDYITASLSSVHQSVSLFL